MMGIFDHEVRMHALSSFEYPGVKRIAALCFYGDIQAAFPYRCSESLHVVRTS